ncbi:MAG TPA: hypothetical protein VK750_09630 [Cytophagaceae bacterium]|jgi:hypothetical protein|nr:hypothetical protein [Cytophagaceae bacterium]
MTKEITRLIEMLKQIKSYTGKDADTSWSSYDDPQELRDELDEYVTKLTDGNEEVIDTLDILFAPTSTFQELSIANNWSDEYLAMAEEFDKIYERLKKKKN